MTMDLYGHLIDHTLWDAARRIDRASEGTTGARTGSASDSASRSTNDKGALTSNFALGAGDRSRTRDILITSEALYQLSYTGVRPATGARAIVPAERAHAGGSTERRWARMEPWTT
jgi:hypothetical protein